MEIGQIIRKKRREKDMTQQELADKVRVTKSTISAWEAGNNLPKCDAFLLILKALELKVEDFEVA